MRQGQRTQQQATLKHQRVSAYEVHHYEQRLKSALAALDEDTALLPRNKELIRSYMKYRAAQGLSVPRQTRYIYCLRKLSRFLSGKLFEDALKEDIIDVVSKIEDEDTAYETKHTDKQCIKCFYRWLRGMDDSKEYPVEVKWIKNDRTMNHSLLPEDLLTEDEIRLMADRALTREIPLWSY